jgi:hypothetical protein
MKTGLEIISAERRMQIANDDLDDDKWRDGELARASAYYATPNEFRTTNTIGFWIIWPWHKSWFKPTPKDRIKELAKAGALIAAEIDRLQRRNLK